MSGIAKDNPRLSCSDYEGIYISFPDILLDKCPSGHIDIDILFHITSITNIVIQLLMAGISMPTINVIIVEAAIVSIIRLPYSPRKLPIQY